MVPRKGAVYPFSCRGGKGGRKKGMKRNENRRIRVRKRVRMKKKVMVMKEKIIGKVMGL